MSKPMSYRHGTEEGAKRCKPPCVNCVRFMKGMTTDSITVTDTNPTLMRIGLPPQMTEPPDIIAFLHSGRFNELTFDKLVGDDWAVTIKAYGDKYIGYGVGADYAFLAAIRRYHNSEPGTGPITITVDQTTHVTSEGHALDLDDSVGIERIWEEDDSETTLSHSGDGEPSP